MGIVPLETISEVQSRKLNTLMENLKFFIPNPTLLKLGSQSEKQDYQCIHDLSTEKYLMYDANFLLTDIGICLVLIFRKSWMSNDIAVLLFSLGNICVERMRVCRFEK